MLQLPHRRRRWRLNSGRLRNRRSGRCRIHRECRSLRRRWRSESARLRHCVRRGHRWRGRRRGSRKFRHRHSRCWRRTRLHRSPRTFGLAAFHCHLPHARRIQNPRKLTRSGWRARRCWCGHRHWNDCRRRRRRPTRRRRRRRSSYRRLTQRLKSLRPDSWPSCRGGARRCNRGSRSRGRGGLFQHANQLRYADSRRGRRAWRDRLQHRQRLRERIAARRCRSRHPRPSRSRRKAIIHWARKRHALFPQRRRSRFLLQRQHSRE